MRLFTGLAGAAWLTASPVAPTAYLCEGYTGLASYGQLGLTLEVDANGAINQRLLRWNPNGNREPKAGLAFYYVLNGEHPARIGPVLDTVTVISHVQVKRKAPATASVTVQPIGGGAATKPWATYAQRRAKGDRDFIGTTPFFREDKVSSAMMDFVDRSLATGKLEVETRVFGDDGKVISVARFVVKDLPGRDKAVAVLAEKVEAMAREPQRFCRTAPRTP
jgi:hypothetical protein